MSSEPVDRAESLGVSLIGAATLALWLGCVTIGILGLRLDYPDRPLPPKEPTVAAVIHMTLTDDLLPAAADAQPGPDSPASDNPAPQPPATPDTALPPAEPLAAVAIPNPAIFAIPVEGPTQVVAAKQASPVARTADAPIAQGAAGVRHLTLGRGMGNQPLPEYPDEARRAGEQGSVVVEFTVGDDGKVHSARVQSPCNSPVLNQAALRAVRDTYHFAPGDAGTYDITIRFQLKTR